MTRSSEDDEREVGDRAANALRNENTGPRQSRTAAIKGREAIAATRRGGTGRTQRQLGHVK